MSASTAPAAAPEPNNTPATTAGTAPSSAPAQGLFTSMLTPVEPARIAAFSLDPQTADGTPATGAVLPSEGLSSAALHNAEDGQQSTKDTGASSGSGKKQQGVVRAWLLAGAARWARGGGTQNKRLDMRKARAMAHQVKEARQVTVNKSGGLGSGTAGSAQTPNASGAGGGKSLNSKATKGGGSAGGGASKGPKNSTNTGGGTGRGPAGRDTNRSADRSGAGPKPGSGGSGEGRGTSGGSSSTKGNTPSPKGGTDNRIPKPSKDTSSHGPKNNKGDTAGGEKRGTQTAAGAPGKSGTNGKTDQPKKTTDTPKNTTPPARKDETSAKPAPARKDAADKTAQTPTKTTDKATETGDKPKADTPATPKGGKPFTTRPSRETGYRDGTRIARTTAHVKAYRDGVKDGIADTTEAADREKARLDQAHADRKTARQETPVPLATSTDHHQNTNPTPIPVDKVSKTHVLLGDGAARASMTRGEVRSLKDMERRLEERATSLTNKAEQTRSLKAHAEEQAAKATRLLEAARGAKGGDKLIGALTQLQEAAQTQATKAEEIHKRSLRAAEATRTTLSNIQARYGGIYQAVIDSPEHAPGELDFYKG